MASVLGTVRSARRPIPSIAGHAVVWNGFNCAPSAMTCMALRLPCAYVPPTVSVVANGTPAVCPTSACTSRTFVGRFFNCTS